MLLIFFCLGIASMTIQSIVIREFLVVFYGNELCMGMIFGVWFLSISIGAGLYSLFSRRLTHPGAVFAVMVFLFSVVPFGQVFLIREARIFLDVSSGMMIPFLSMAGWTIAVIAPYGLIMGSVFPMGCRLYGGGEEGAQSIAALFSVESAGALLGGGAFSYVLVERFSPFEILWGLLLLFWVSLGVYIMLSYGPALRKAAAVYLIGCIAGAFLLLPLVPVMERETLLKRWNSLVASLPLVRSLDSRYQNLVLTEQQDQYSVYGNGSYLFSFPDPYSDRITANMVLAEHPHPRKLLLLGVASGGFIAECLKHPLESVHYVLLDEALMKLTGSHLTAYERDGYESPRVRIFYTDGRYWVNRAEEKYDVIFLAMADPSNSMLNRFYTREFFLSLKKVMNAGATLALSISSSSNFLGSEMTDYNVSLYNTLKGVFPFVEMSPGERIYFFASSSPAVVTSDIEILKKRILSRSIKEEDFSPYLFEELFYPERVDFVKKAFKNRPSRVNTDLCPISYFYNLLIWDRISGSKMARALHFIESLSPALVLAILCALLLFRGLFVFIGKTPRHAQEKFNLLMSVAIFGFCAMGIEIVLIFSYQNIFGYLYKMIGVLVASFMFGLAAGSMGGREFLRRKEGHSRLMVLTQLFLVVFALLIPPALGVFSRHILAVMSPEVSQGMFLAGIVITGLLNGLVFPLAGGLYLRHEPDAGRVAGFIDAADHLGAGAGGFAFGTFFVPLLGIGWCCYVMALLGLGGVILWGLMALSRPSGGSLS